MEIERPLSKQPIPKQAKEVFKGKIFSVWQWEQELFDGTYKTFEKIKRPDSVNVFPVTQDGKIILTKQEQPGRAPFLGCIGGVIDPGEDPLEAAKRELMEESGCSAEEYFLWDALHPGSMIDWVVFTFVAKGVKKVKDLAPDAGEKIELLYLSFDEFLEVLKDRDYRDSEVALKIFRAKQDPQEFEKLKQIFSLR